MENINLSTKLQHTNKWLHIYSMTCYTMKSHLYVIMHYTLVFFIAFALPPTPHGNQLVHDIVKTLNTLSIVFINTFGLYNPTNMKFVFQMIHEVWGSKGLAPAETAVLDLLLTCSGWLMTPTLGQQIKLLLLHNERSK